MLITILVCIYEKKPDPEPARRGAATDRARVCLAIVYYSYIVRFA